MHQIVQHITEMAVVVYPKRPGKFRTSHPLPDTGKPLDNRHIPVRMGVHRAVQSPVLVLQQGIVREKHSVYILRHTPAKIKQTQIIRNTDPHTTNIILSIHEAEAFQKKSSALIKPLP